MTSDPRISVALCTYNGARFLREQLDSIAAQTLLPCEIVACDDASTDGTIAVINAFAADSSIPVRLHQNEQTLGVTRNFDQAIGLCKGEFVALADQDDIWQPHKLARLYDALQTTPDTSYAFSDARLIDETGRDSGGKSLLSRRFILASIASGFSDGRELDLMLKRDFIYGTTLLFRTEERTRFQPIPATWSHDTWIVNALALRTRRGVPVLEPLVKYRQHAVQASGGTASPRSVRYADRVRAYEDLREAVVLATEARPDALFRIDDKLRYLHAMVAMENASVARRATIALREMTSGRWMRYSPRTFLVDKRLGLSRFRR